MKKQLNKSEIKEINPHLVPYSYELQKKDRVEVNDQVIIVNNIPAFFQKDGMYIPTLKFLPYITLKKATIDMGAVKFIVSGADIMRPGITAVDEHIQQGEIIQIIDQNYGKALAIGKALFSGKELKALDKGKCILNLHFVGDEIWNIK